MASLISTRLPPTLRPAATRFLIPFPIRTPFEVTFRVPFKVTFRTLFKVTFRVPSGAGPAVSCVTRLSGSC